MRAPSIRLLGLRSLVIGAAVVGFATAANAGTLTVYTTDTANVLKNTFVVGETILLKVDGDGQGYIREDSIEGVLRYDGAITNTLALFQPVYLRDGGGATTPCPNFVLCMEGRSYAFLQTGAGVPPINQTGTSVITLLAVAPGVSQVTWSGRLLDFFGIYGYPAGGELNIPTGHSFTITPEPATTTLIVLGLLGLAAWRKECH